MQALQQVEVSCAPYFSFVRRLMWSNESSKKKVTCERSRQVSCTSPAIAVSRSLKE